VDLFTHVLVAYLVTYGLVGFQPQYLAAGALAGGLPDADVIFFPLARRFPVLRHHGITHSLFGVTVVAAVGGLLFAPRIVPGNPLLYFAVMEAAGVAHMLMDGFTHFSVPPLLPFSNWKLEIDADRAINLLTLVVSVVAFYLLLGVERNRVPFQDYVVTIYVLSAFFVIYFGLRLAGRIGVRGVMRRNPEFRVPVPTSNPLSWLLLSETKAGGREVTVFARYTLGKGFVSAPRRIDVPLEAPGGPSSPARSESDALERTYGVARKESRMLDETYHFADVSPKGPGGWEVVWYSLEYAAFGRAAAVRVEVAPDGTTRAKSAWHTPMWRRELT
jgi:membrane-bound metal-dependent hydrolase YbcI (DUF457 family)